MSNDPRAIIAEGRMSRFQVVAIAIIVGLAALDGFDVQSMSFAAPGIAAEWNVQPGALGIALSSGIVGMGFGSLLIAPLADTLGRRPVLIGCLLLMIVGMLLSATADGIAMLCVWRVVTGVGIGAMLASINAMAYEYASDRRRNLVVSILVIGYPVGAVTGGLISAVLLANYDWRAVFLFGGIATALFLPLLLWFVPESIGFLAHKQPKDALPRINATLRRMGHPTIDALAPPPADRGRPTDIFGPGLRALTIAVSLAYLLHMLTFYYMLTWLPKIVVNLGFTQPEGAQMLVWANVGGAVGGAVFGMLSARVGLRVLTALTAFGTFALVTAFGNAGRELSLIVPLVIAAGFFWNSTIVGFYAICARGYPSHARASGTGFMLGVGRGGSVLAPTLTGFLFQAGYGLPGVSLLMAMGSLGGAIVIWTMIKSSAIETPAPGSDREGSTG